MLKAVLFVLTLVFATLVTVAQKPAGIKSFVGRTVWSRFDLPVSAEPCRAVIAISNLSPGTDNCHFWVPVKDRTELRIVEARRQGKHVLLKLKANDLDPFILFLARPTDKVFRKIFATTFTFKDPGYSYHDECSSKTRGDVIRRSGFPDRIMRWPDREEWIYGIPRYLCGFEIATITIKRGKVRSIGGVF